MYGHRQRPLSKTGNPLHDHDIAVLGRPGWAKPPFEMKVNARQLYDYFEAVVKHYNKHNIPPEFAKKEAALILSTWESLKPFTAYQNDNPSGKALAVQFCISEKIKNPQNKSLYAFSMALGMARTDELKNALLNIFQRCDGKPVAVLELINHSKPIYELLVRAEFAKSGEFVAYEQPITAAPDSVPRHGIEPPDILDSYQEFLCLPSVPRKSAVPSEFRTFHLKFLE